MDIAVAGQLALAAINIAWAIHGVRCGWRTLPLLNAAAGGFCLADALTLLVR